MAVFARCSAVIPSCPEPARNREAKNRSFDQAGRRPQRGQVYPHGSTYEVASAVRFLHGKWDANAAEVKSARDFIDKVASISGTSGKSYLIRFNDGSEIKSREYLLAELQKLEP